MKRILNIFVTASVVAVLLTSCGASRPNSPGPEYAPDMYRSPAIEAYVDYGMDEYIVGVDEARQQRNTPSARKPVAGTIPFGGTDFVYPYPNTTEGYEQAGRYLTSAYPMTKENIERGKAIYDKMCTHCHGKNGHGDGKIAQNEFILGIPDYATKLKDLAEGKMFHSITYGKGLMGSHASQLTPKERWQVIDYIHIMQNDGKMPKYNKDGYAIGYERYWGDYGYRAYLQSTGLSGAELDQQMLDWAAMKDGQMSQGQGGELEGATQSIEMNGDKRKWWQKLIDKGVEKVGDIKEKRAAKKAAKGE